MNESIKAPLSDVVFVFLANGPSRPSIALPRKITIAPKVLRSINNK